MINQIDLAIYFINQLLDNASNNQILFLIALAIVLTIIRMIYSTVERR